MREIKFRVHDADTGEILAYEYFNSGLNWGYYWLDAKEFAEEGGEAICHASPEYFKHPQPFGELLRVLYTGLKDKNGKEAYHKDIIKRADKLYIMEWHDNLASWYLNPLHGGWHGITKSDMSLMCEIVGNILETPEILEKVT